MAVDFGLKRVGVAITDELHISITPLPTLLYDAPQFWDNIVKIIKDNEIAALVLGVPYEQDEEHPMREPIKVFERKLNNILEVLEIKVIIFYQNESFTSRRAVYTMLEIGTKKKKRSQKGTTDAIAAGLILKEWIENNG